MIIAIDGPAGSGKTTIARFLAKRLHIYYLDTGATYRVLTLKAIADNVDLTDGCSLRKTSEVINMKIEGDRIYLDNKDVSKEIRTPVIDKNISTVVSFPEVREVMVKLQRELAYSGDFVVEGRDVTTVVFPQAEYKFYFDAEIPVRAERRFKELASKGINIDYNEVEDDLIRRDYADKNRKVGALKISNDAIYLDTTKLSIDEVVEKMISHISKTRPLMGKI